MKTLFILLLAVFSATTIMAQGGNFDESEKSAIVDNLTVGIDSDNLGLRTSSSQVLSNLITETNLNSDDASGSMIPLLNMLENGETESERICAAVALFKLGNPIGIYRLRGVAIFDDNEKVSSVCKNLYYSYHKLNGTEYFIDF
jgi:hypothetical protein